MVWYRQKNQTTKPWFEPWFFFGTLQEKLALYENNNENQSGAQGIYFILCVATYVALLKTGYLENSDFGKKANCNKNQQQPQLL